LNQKMNLKLTIYVLLLVNFQTLAQSTLYQTSLEKDFQAAFELYSKDQFLASKTAFEKLLDKPKSENKKVEVEYYHALASLKSAHPEGTTLMEAFILDNPQSNELNAAALTLGNYFFHKKDYRKAIENFRLIDIDAYYSSQRPEVLFKMGFSFFQLKNYAQALQHLEQAKRFRSPFLADAYYYAGYSYFQQKEYDKAIADFLQAEKSREYANKVPYMLSAIYYQQENFEALVQYAPTVLDRSGLEKKEQVHLLLAEAYHEQNDHVNAAQNYGAFVASKKGKLTRDQQYKAGVSHYETNKFLEASNFFKEVALQNDHLGQVSSYFLGHAYLKLGNPQFAANSFSAAYKADHDQEIKKEALFNYAKVNLERGNFQDAVIALDTYLDKYPDGKQVLEAENLLSDALINTNNYLRAIEHMEKIRDKSDRIKAAYQKVTFYQGIAYFRDNKYGQALQLFDKSLQFPMDKTLQYNAQYWKGETHAVNNNIQEAIRAFERLINMKPPANDPNLIKAHYGLGYAYFNTEQYEKAEQQFKLYTDKLRGSNQKENYEDALMRLGDSYYVQKKFPDALSVFNRAIGENSSLSDYAYFRAGVVLNFQNKNQEAIRQLDQVVARFPNSRYMEDALFQKAQINMEDSRYREGRDGFTALINKKPNSPFLPYALEGRAVANYSLQDYDKAIEDYKKILDEYPNADNGETALVGLQESLALQGRSEEFSKYLSGYRRKNPSSSNLQNVEFEAAKSLVFNQSYKEAIEALEDFIRNYPNAAQTPEARYYLGDAHLRMGDKDKALDIFYELENTNDNNLKNRVFQVIAKIEFDYGNLKKSIPYFRYNAAHARNKIEEYEANNGLMNAYFEIAVYDSSLFFAEKVLELGNITVDAAPTALLVKGKSLEKRNEMDKAAQTYRDLMASYKTEQGAEALYLLALIDHEKGQYEASNELIFDNSQAFGPYEFWYGKMFILLAKNYLGADEKFQAKATLESIVENSSSEPVIKEATQLLETVN